MNDALQSLMPGIYQQVFNSAAMPGGQNKMTPLDALAKQNVLGALKLPSGMGVPTVKSANDLLRMSPGKLNGMWHNQAQPAWQPHELAKLLSQFGLPR